MAFVRWRGNSAELLATVYENGKSRQILLVNLPLDHASDMIREQVAKEHPQIHVDWLAVERALARGPKTKPAPEPPLTILQAENLLRTIAQAFRDSGLMPWVEQRLSAAADVLTSLRTDPQLAAVCQRYDVNPSENPSQPSNLSSDDSARPPPPEGGPAGALSTTPEQGTVARAANLPASPAPSHVLNPPDWPKHFRTQWPNISGITGSNESECAATPSPPCAVRSSSPCSQTNGGLGTRWSPRRAIRVIATMWQRYRRTRRRDCPVPPNHCHAAPPFHYVWPALLARA